MTTKKKKASKRATRIFATREKKQISWYLINIYCLWKAHLNKQYANEATRYSAHLYDTITDN